MANKADEIKALKNIRTMEDVAYLLNILYTNLNNLDRVYYDMLINPTPMDIELQRYDDKGELVTVTLPNRAKDLISTYTGIGNPNGKQIADAGALYLDLDALNLYFKASGSDSYAWYMLFTSSNLVAGVDYLAPNGNGSQLTSLNLDNVGSGLLRVSRGGTGTTILNGVLKGNGTDAVTSAVIDTDYVSPTQLTGIICYYPVTNIPKGWLVCDGAPYSRVTYRRLFDIIGTKYGSGDGNTTFNVPDLSGVTIRGYASNVTQALGVTVDGTVGGHTHDITGVTSDDGNHSHSRGTMNITGRVVTNQGGSQGAFYDTGTNYIWGGGRSDAKQNGGRGFDASRSWTGYTSVEGLHSHTLTGTASANSLSENTVKNITLIPIIKY